MHWAWLAAVWAVSLGSGCRGGSFGAGDATSAAPTALSRSTAASGGAPAPPGAEALRDEARLVLERHCGQCHVRDAPTALPAALAVYDLRERDWSARMSDAQLRSALWRLGEPLPPEGRPNDVGPEDRERFRDYVDAELARRARLDGGGAR